MARVSIDPSLFVPLMPVALVGSVVRGKPNFMAAAWLSRVNYQPPILSVALNANHYTPRGIREHGAFSVCIPSAALVAEADYCGLVSGKRTDKSGLFELFPGQLAGAPLIARCALNVECRLRQVVELPSNHVFYGDVVAVHADEAVLRDGKPDPARLDPLILTMPDNGYWSLGQRLAEAWSVGRTLEP